MGQATDIVLATETMTAEELKIALPAPKGGYFSFQQACEVHNEHDPDWRDVSLDPVPPADQDRMDIGVAYEADISRRWAELISPDEVPKAALELASEERRAAEDEPYLIRLASYLSGFSAVWVPESDKLFSKKSRRTRENITMAAMRAEVPFIWNARLPACGMKVSEPDFLVRAAPDVAGYYPGDVKAASVYETSPGAGPNRFWISEMADPSKASAAYRTAPRGAESLKLKHVMQLAHYHEHLASLGFAPQNRTAWGAVLGTEGTLVWQNLQSKKRRKDPATGKFAELSVIDYYSRSFDRNINVAMAARDKDAAPLARPALKTECAPCKYRTTCRNLLEDEGHLSLVNGITPTKVKRYSAAGASSIADLAYLDIRTAAFLSTGLKHERIVEKAHESDPSAPIDGLVSARTGPDKIAALKEAGIRTAQDICDLDTGILERFEGSKSLLTDIDSARARREGKVFLRRGLDDFEMPTGDIEIDVDMENDPAASGIIYMWGTLLKVWAKGMQLPGKPYRPFVTWDDSDASEAAVFADFWRWLTAMRTVADSVGISLRVYVYSKAEERCMRHLSDKHNGIAGIPTQEDIDALVDSECWVDMYELVRRQFVWPTDSLSLKSIGKWARHTWRGDSPSGDESVVWYRKAVSGDPDSRARILHYNEDDVVATKVIRKTLIGLRKKGVANAASLDQKYIRRMRVRASA